MINYEEFEMVFSTENMPRNKQEYMTKLYQLYLQGRIDREKEIKQKMTIFLTDIKGE